MGRRLAVSKKIVQIATAERGWHLKKDGVKNEVACWALLEDGSVVPLIQNENLDGLDAADDVALLLSPVESWQYALARKPPTESDWECIGVAQEGILVWRRPHD